MMKELQILEKLGGVRVLCLGDVMLDKFVYGKSDRLSPEAPIPVLAFERESKMPGGGANVARNLAALGVAVDLIGAVGADMAAQELQDLLKAQGNITPHLIADSIRVTTVKNRFIASNQQMLRVDHETRAPISKNIEDKAIDAAGRAIAKVQAVVISDYGKGFVTPHLVQEVIKLAKKSGIPVLADPKGRDYARYRGADLLSPNAKELSEASGVTLDGDDAVTAAAQKIIKDCGLGSLLCTRGAEGMSLIGHGAPLHVKAGALEVYDVSGAGDTVIATLAACLAAGAELPLAASLANVAAGIVVGKLGTATASVFEMRHRILHAGSAIDNKFKSGQGLLDLVALWRKDGLKIGFTNGCFDLIHPGHVSLIRQARSACDRLIVAINSDDSVRRLKGASRPIQDEESRATILASLADVDAITVFGDDTPMRLIESVRPDVLVKGADYNKSQVVGGEFVESYGGKIILARLEDGFSTSNTVKKIALA